jgi:diaminopimelate decarboxylase
MPTTRDGAGLLCLGGVPLSELARDPRVGTPSYVYDLDGMAEEARALRAAFGEREHLVCYAVKANGAGAVVRTLVEAGCGADVVSGAELALALRCGAAPEHVVYSGVAKLDWELDLAIGAGPRGIGAIQVESVEEIARVAARARAAGRTAALSIRVNPMLDEVDTHAHVATGHDEAKFGVPLEDVPDALAAIRGAGGVTLVGLACHVGSQLVRTEHYLEGAKRLFSLAREVRATMPLRFVDTGGGFGIDYGAGCEARPADFVRAALRELEAHGLGDLPLHVEPGRALVAAHAVLLASVVQEKRTRHAPEARRWLMVDAGMNDLLRPALYQAVHRVVPCEALSATKGPWRVVGPVCESSDDFGTHELPDAPPAHVAFLDAGAYGYSMASQYNGRALPTEVFLRGGKVESVRTRAPWDAWVEERSR